MRRALSTGSASCFYPTRHDRNQSEHGSGTTGEQAHFGDHSQPSNCSEFGRTSNR
jgi:hypothetical protein